MGWKYGSVNLTNSSAEALMALDAAHDLGAPTPVSNSIPEKAPWHARFPTNVRG